MKFRRVGKGALAPCPPHSVNWRARSALPTLRKSSIQFSKSTDRHCERSELIRTPSFRDGPQDQTSDVQLHIGESRDSGFDASLRPGMTASYLLTRVHALAAQCARGVEESSAQRGRGERRMPVAPAASCALGSGRSTRVTTSTPESPDVPARNGFNGFLRALVTGLVCHRRLRICLV